MLASLLVVEEQSHMRHLQSEHEQHRRQRAEQVMSMLHQGVIQPIMVRLSVATIAILALYHFSLLNLHPTNGCFASTSLHIFASMGLLLKLKTGLL
jgi:hypothetical protein